MRCNFSNSETLKFTKLQPCNIDGMSTFFQTFPFQFHFVVVADMVYKNKEWVLLDNRRDKNPRYKIPWIMGLYTRATMVVLGSTPCHFPKKGNSAHFLLIGRSVVRIFGDLFFANLVFRLYYQIRQFQ